LSEVAALIADMVRAGVDPELIGRTAAALARRNVDEQAERRRAADRERKARLRNSAESADTPAPDKETPPAPPKEINPFPHSPPSGAHTPAKPTPRTELEAVLDASRAEAVIDHRNRIRKPLTAHAAHLLAGKFARCPDPNAAADAMIANGWQGFEPGWLDRPSARAGPTIIPIKDTAANAARRRIEALQNEQHRETSAADDHQSAAGSVPLLAGRTG
jgi:hypothetical protein